MIDFKKKFSEFNNKNVLIIGDSMIDAYTWGEINRKSPEAPVPVIEVKKHEKRLGGAANVALNIQSLGANPILCSVIGNDNNGVIFKKLLKESSICSKKILVDSNKKTTIKTRVIANNQHQIRIDEEDTNEIKNEDKFIKIINQEIKKTDVIILQDYNKGTLTRKIISEIIKTAHKNNIPTIVDPKKDNFKQYKNCTVFKPNLKELKEGMNSVVKSDDLAEISKISKNLLDEISADCILVTLSENGIGCRTKSDFEQTPAFNRDIVDVSGAGDTVISVASLCLAVKLKYSLMSKLSSLAGGLVCKKVGVVPIDKNELLDEALIKL